MTLTDIEYKQYLNVNLRLLFFAGHQLNIVSKKTNFKQFLDLDLNIKFQCRQELAKNPSILDNYIQLFFEEFTEEEIKILNAFKKQIKSKFIILKCLTNYAIFMDTNSDDTYAVKALGDPFDYMFDSFPVLVTTAILPFKDKIIYDGFFEAPIMYVGSNMAKTFNNDYKKAKKQGKIISSIK